MAAQTVAQMTADELLAMSHNGYRCELVQGELRQMALAGGDADGRCDQPPSTHRTVYRAPDDICILTEGDMLDGGDVVPGWKMPLADAF